MGRIELRKTPDAASSEEEKNKNKGLWVTWSTVASSPKNFAYPRC